MIAINVMRILSVILMVTMIVAGAEAKSFLVNGDLEEGVDDEFPGWTRSFYPQRDGNIGDCISRSDERAKSGRWSLKIDTAPVLEQEVTLVFNAAVSQEAADLQNQQFVIGNPQCLTHIGAIVIDHGRPPLRPRPAGAKVPCDRRRILEVHDIGDNGSRYARAQAQLIIS